MIAWIQSFDWKTLHWLHDTLQCGVMDFVMPCITALGNGGAICVFPHRCHGFRIDRDGDRNISDFGRENDSSHKDINGKSAAAGPFRCGAFVMNYLGQKRDPILHFTAVSLSNRYKDR